MAPKPSSSVSVSVTLKVSPSAGVPSVLIVTLPAGASLILLKFIDAPTAAVVLTPSDTDIENVGAVSSPLSTKTTSASAIWFCVKEVTATPRLLASSNWPPVTRLILNTRPESTSSTSVPANIPLVIVVVTSSLNVKLLVVITGATLAAA